MPRMEVSTSMQLSDVQTDNYWRDRYRHDNIREKKWEQKPKPRRSSSFKVIPVAPQLRPVEKSTSQSQMTLGGRRSSYEWSVPPKSASKSQSVPNLLKTPPPLKQQKRQYLAPQQGGRYSLSPTPSRPNTSLSTTSSRYLVPEVCSTSASSINSPASTRKPSFSRRSCSDKDKDRDTDPSKSPLTAKRSFVPDFSNIGRAGHHH